MDPSTRLDHVLFQLTPTRTRCDLVIFSGNLNEKLAYGLLEPFIAHLRSAKDQISKGGYSVTLRPSSSAILPWFTKATLQRFVRFVSTPEVLERFVTIEREIAQLDNSIKSYEAQNGDGGLGTDAEGNAAAVGGTLRNSTGSLKLKGEHSDNSDPMQEENSKVRLQRVVETRKAVLRKEQAMVYARSLAAGFEMDYLDDLLCFSDAFGASRLREACINFKDLCKKKNEDRLWVDEIAAMQALVQPDLSYLGTSGIILAEDNDQNFMIGGRQNGGTDMSMSDSVTSQGSSDANQDNGSALPTDTRAQIPNPWVNQFPPYLRNFQGPVYPQMPPYQGYGYPGMQVPPPYYPPNMQWPPNPDHESHDRHDHKRSSRKKGKGYNSMENEEQDGSTESGGSSSEAETNSSPERSHRKKHGKKSSRKVVIRNINYITSKRDGERNGASEMDSSDEDGYLDGNSLKQQLEDAVGSFEKHSKSSSRHHKKRNGSKQRNTLNGSVDHDEDGSMKNDGIKGNENWAALQQLLLTEEPDSNCPDTHQVQVEEENSLTTKSGEKGSYASDDFLVSEKGIGYNHSTVDPSIETFEPIETNRPAMSITAPEELMFSQRTEEPESYPRVTLSDDTAHLSVVKSQTSDDWFVSKRLNETGSQAENHLRLIDGDYVAPSDKVENTRKDVIIDDAFMIQGRINDEPPESQLGTNLRLVSDIVDASFAENGRTEVPQKESESHGFYEPDDLYMVRDRDTVVEPPVASWGPEIDYENNISVGGPVKSQSDAEVNADSNLTSKEKTPSNKKSGSSVTRASGKDMRSRTSSGPLRKGKPDTTLANRRSTFGSKTSTSMSPIVKEEERRKRMEELLIQRQKRITERKALNGGTTVSSRKPQTGNKTAAPGAAAKKNKPTIKSSTIERLATAKTASKVPTPPKKTVSKVNSRLQKTSSVDNKKTDTNKTKSSEKKVDGNIKDISSTISDVNEGKGIDRINASVLPTEVPSVQGLQTSNGIDDSKDIKELHITSSVINMDMNVSKMDTFDEKSDNAIEDCSIKLNSFKDNNIEIPKKSFPSPEEKKSFDDHGKRSPDMSAHPLPESPTKPLSTTLNLNEKGSPNENNKVSPEISEIIESTPPITSEVDLDPILTRKKWDSAENSPKVAKGFRKLLMFGRKT